MRRRLKREEKKLSLFDHVSLSQFLFGPSSRSLFTDQKLLVYRKFVIRCGHDAHGRNSKLILTRRFNVSNGLSALRLQRICPTISDDEKPCATNPATVNRALIFSIGLPFEIRSFSEAFIWKDTAARNQLLPSLLFCFVEIVSSRLAPSRITNSWKMAPSLKRTCFARWMRRFRYLKPW